MSDKKDAKAKPKGSADKKKAEDKSKKAPNTKPKAAAKSAAKKAVLQQKKEEFAFAMPSTRYACFAVFRFIPTGRQAQSWCKESPFKVCAC